MSSITDTYVRFIEDTFSGALMTLRSKMADYSEVSDPFSNFRHAANTAGVTINQVFMVMEGIKAARLKQLLTSGHEPNNESLADTFDDFINYLAIHKAYLELKDTADPTYAYAADVAPEEMEYAADGYPEEGAMGDPDTQNFISNQGNMASVADLDLAVQGQHPPATPAPATPADFLATLSPMEKIKLLFGTR
jgi:hypothetical protein